MVLPETPEHAHQTDCFIADDSIAVIFESGVFSSVYKLERKTGTGKIKDLEKCIAEGLEEHVVVGNKDLTQVYDDGDLFLRAFQKFDIGIRDDQKIRLTDIKDKTVINKVRNDLKKQAGANPNRKMLIFYGVAGHGLQVDGE